MYRIQKSVETESRLMVAMAWEGGWGVTANGCGFLFSVTKITPNYVKITIKKTFWENWGYLTCDSQVIIR